MKKIFTLAAAVLASFSLWAATESNPTADVASNDEVSGTSYTIDGNYVAGLGGTKAGDMTTKGIKFRLNRDAGELSNAVEFKVNEGYVITKIDFCGHVNDNSKTSTIKQVLVDGVDINAAPVDLPAKTSSASFSYTINATESFIMVFEGSGTQANIEYTITYEEAVQKEVDHVDVTLGGVAVNGKALGELDMATLYGALTLNLAAEYVEAPTVTFTVQTDTYYVGETEPSTKSEKIDVVAALNPDGKWQAQQTVGEKTYTITAVKPATVTITYMDGATVLGEEIVKVGETSTKHAEFETKPLAEFQGWYTDAELTSKADLSAAVGADITFYGKFVKAYAKSLNIEQLVLDNGKGADIDSLLLARGYEFANIDQLDSLNDEKDNRNYPYLGLKLKKAGAYVGFNLQAGSTAKLRFGNVAAPFVIEVNGENDTITADAANIHTDSIKTEEYIAEQDVYIRIRCLEEKKTIVIKQIMINEEIATVTLPGAPVVEPTLYTVTLNEPVYGTLSFAMTGADGKFAEGDTVRLSVVPEDGYYIDDVTAVGSKIETGAIEVQAANDGTYYFVMPADDVTVEAIIEEFPAVVETYTVTLAEAEHGRLSFALVGATGEFEENIDVPVLATPDDGYKVGQVTIGNEVLIADAEGVYHFTMPAYDVTVTATFVPESEGIEDVNAAKAVKRLENGMLLIEKNGKMFNVIGARIK